MITGFTWLPDTFETVLNTSIAAIFVENPTRRVAILMQMSMYFCSAAECTQTMRDYSREQKRTEDREYKKNTLNNNSVHCTLILFSKTPQNESRSDQK